MTSLGMLETGECNCPQVLDFLTTSGDGGRRDLEILTLREARAHRHSKAEGLTIHSER